MKWKSSFLFVGAMLAFALYAVYLGNALSQQGAKPPSELRLESPNGKVVILLKADDIGAALWMTDRATAKERLASLTTRANGGPALCLHDDIHQIPSRGFDAALSASTEGGGLLQLGRGKAVKIFGLDDFVVQSPGPGPQRMPLKKSPKLEQQSKNICPCGDGKSLCSCGPACDCDSDYWNGQVLIRYPEK